MSDVMSDYPEHGQTPDEDRVPTAHLVWESVMDEDYTSTLVINLSFALTLPDSGVDGLIVNPPSGLKLQMHTASPTEPDVTTAVNADNGWGSDEIELLLQTFSNARGIFGTRMRDVFVLKCSGTNRLVLEVHGTDSYFDNLNKVVDAAALALMEVYPKIRIFAQLLTEYRPPQER